MNKESKVLILEDESIIALDIKNSICDLGFYVTNLVDNYVDAANSIEKDPPNFIIVDIKLGDMKDSDGIDIVKKIQKENKHINIIYLTSFYDNDTINRAIETNPIAYLCKPFLKEQLQATILLGQSKHINNHKIIYNDKFDHNIFKLGLGYSYEFSTKRLLFKDSHIKLSKNEVKLLEILIKSKDSITPFSTLEYHIWDNNICCQSALRTLIYRLRIKLKYNFIETIHSIGCKLNIK
jgi:DNA-binding response OmpR family regulator